jgi:transposase
MTLHPTPVSPVPDETARIARAALPKSNVYVQMHDVMGAIYTDEQLADLFAGRGRPVVPPWRLALVTVMQFAEGLSDRQAAEAVRVRIDWKYALGLELEDTGFDYTLLCEFHARLLQGSAEERLLDTRWTPAPAADCSKPADANVPTARMCWGCCGCLAASSAWPRRCERRSMP